MKKFRILCFECREEINSYPFMIMDNKILCMKCGDKNTSKLLHNTNLDVKNIKKK